MNLRIKTRPEDFIVREVLRRKPGQIGDFAVYRVTKRLLTTIEVQQRLGAQIGAPPHTLSFPALKDKAALATQYFSIKGRAPDRLSGEGYVAEFEGRYPHALAPADLAGNWFTVTLRGMDGESIERLLGRLAEIGEAGFPNYFDDQRFGSYAAGGVFLGKLVLQGDAEGALKTYFTQPLAGDPPALKQFKQRAGELWGDWPALFELAPRSNHRSILTFLKDHPRDYRKALNLVTPRLLPLLLAAYQSYLWNKVASALVRKAMGEEAAFIEVAGERLAIHRSLSQGAMNTLKGELLPLPQHNASYPDPQAAAAVREVLEAEKLTLAQMKARILTRAYLPKGSRPLLVFPEGAQGQHLEASEGHVAVITYFLPPGSYATLLLKVLQATS